MERNYKFPPKADQPAFAVAKLGFAQAGLWLKKF